MVTGWDTYGYRLGSVRLQAEQLRCPCVDPKCNAPLQPADVARCLKAPEAVARYERLALQRCVEADEGMGCCPSAGCEFMFAFDLDNRKRAAWCSGGLSPRRATARHGSPRLATSCLLASGDGAVLAQGGPPHSGASVRAAHQSQGSVRGSGRRPEPEASALASTSVADSEPLFTLSSLSVHSLHGRLECPLCVKSFCAAVCCKRRHGPGAVLGRVTARNPQATRACGGGLSRLLAAQRTRGELLSRVGCGPVRPCGPTRAAHSAPRHT